MPVTEGGGAPPRGQPDGRSAHLGWISAAALLAVLCAVSVLLQLRTDADDAAHLIVRRPRYAAGGGPRVCLDKGHFNYATTRAGYRPLELLLRSDGYRVTGYRGRFRRAVLERCDVLVIANPQGYDEAADFGRPAFRKEELALLGDWVRGGGRLLVAADPGFHAEATAALCARLGVRVEPAAPAGLAVASLPLRASRAIRELSASAGTIARHPVARGASAEESVGRVVVLEGQRLRAGGAATAVLRVPGGASRDVGQLVAAEVGKGRVVASGDAQLFTLGSTPRGGATPGLLWRGAQNRQLVLNTFHWLSSRSSR